MKENRLLTLLSEISDRYIAEADPEKKNQIRSRTVLRWGTLAASVVLVIGLSLFALPYLRGNDTDSPAESGAEPLPPSVESTETALETLVSSDALWVDTRERNDRIVLGPDLALEWSWEDKTNLERYTSVTVDGASYRSRGAVLPEEYLGEKISAAEASGWDSYTEETHAIPCEVYAIADLPPRRLVAVRFDGENDCIVFVSDEYDPPKTLADFMEEYRLTTYLPLTKVRWSQDNFSQGYFHLSDETSSAIWQMLAEAGKAEIIRDDIFRHDLSTNLSFTVDAPVYGLHNKSFRITSDGYLITNLAEYGYYYEIGQEMAGRILETVTGNLGDPVEPEPIFHLVGTVTEVGDDYFKLDDSALMKNPEDGMVFTVSALHPHVSRMLRRGYIRVGSTVSVEYDGIHSAADPACVGGAFAVHEAIITTGGDVLIPE